MRLDLSLYTNFDGYIQVRNDGGAVVVELNTEGGGRNHSRRLNPIEARALARALFTSADWADASTVRADIRPELAEEIIVDQLHHTITIDGTPLDYQVLEEWRVEGGPIPTLNITIPAVRVLVQ